MLGLNFKDKNVQSEFSHIYLLLEKQYGTPLVWKNNVIFFGKFYMFCLPKNEECVETNKLDKSGKVIKLTSKSKIVPMIVRKIVKREV